MHPISKMFFFLQNTTIRALYITAFRRSF